MKNMIGEKELSMGEIFAYAFNIYKAKIKMILFIILIISIPSNLIIDLLSPYSNKLGSELLKIIGVYIDVFIEVGAIYITYKYVNDEYVECNQLCKAIFSRWKGIIWTTIVAGIILLGFSLLLVIPGVIFWIYYSFIFQAVVIKNLSGTDALSYSKNLVKGYWWNLFIIQILRIITAVIVILPINFISKNVIYGVISNTSVHFVMIFFDVAITICFFSLDSMKNKRDGTYI
ncbi:hypothetical protein [Clostridium ganghwense]|uniref:DUF7847 domain-containing protein n=1 Tax=Clostridium ganghwense TaxID=312089 RepID=A0ABT4CLK0_9CLOT|nr:hypothetical protein [Clostridium ganghwense]MCY6369922.1 hypothetical protein [Clostridium ganghwense]